MRWFLLAILIALSAVPPAHALDINAGQAIYLKYIIRDANGVPVETTIDNLALFITKAGAATIDTKTLTGSNCWAVGYGVYQVLLDDTDTDTPGPLNTILLADVLGTISLSPREDVVVTGAAAWQGEEVRIWTFDADDNPLPSCHIQVRNLAGVLHVDQRLSGVDGYADFILSQGSYRVYAWGVGVSFATSPDTMTVVGGMSFIMRGTEFIPAAPSVPDLANVYGWLVDAAGDARAGVTLTFALQAPGNVRPILISEGRVVSRATLSAVTDSLGGFSIDLIPQAAMSPAGIRYKVTISDSPSEIFYIGPTDLEAGGSFDLSDIL